MSSKTTSPSETLCALRWHSPTFNLSNRSVKICCRTPKHEISEVELLEKGAESLLNNSYLLQRRKEMWQGIKHSDCDVCWDAEKRKEHSFRNGSDRLIAKQKEKNPFFSEKDNFDSLPIDNPLFKANSPWIVEFILGSMCDLKCLYCGRENSSKWAKEDLEQGKISPEQYSNLLKSPDPLFYNTFWKWFETVAGTVSVFSVLGGEPTFYSNLSEVIQKAHDCAKASGNVGMRIRIITNLNCPRSALEKLIHILKKLDLEGQKILFDISLDSIGSHAESLRDGLNWNRFESSLHQILALNLSNLTLSFLPTINALNIAHLKEFILFARNLGFQYKRQIPFHLNIVSHPSWLAPRVLTPDFRFYIAEAIELLNSSVEQHISKDVQDWGNGWHLFAKFLSEVHDSISTLDPHLASPELNRQRIDFFLRMLELERIRSFDFNEKFPRYREFYQMCKGLAIWSNSNVQT